MTVRHIFQSVHGYRRQYFLISAWIVQDNHPHMVSKPAVADELRAFSLCKTSRAELVILAGSFVPTCTGLKRSAFDHTELTYHTVVIHAML